MRLGSEGSKTEKDGGLGLREKNKVPEKSQGPETLMGSVTLVLGMLPVAKCIQRMFVIILLVLALNH